MTDKQEKKSKLLSEMSKDDFQNLMDGYFAPAEKRIKMTEKEIKDLAAN